MSTTSKVAFITGANKGIGLETAKQLAALGIQVVLGSRDLARGKKALEELSAKGLTAELLQFEVTNEADHAKAYRYFDEHHGKLDILINNAAINSGDSSTMTSLEVLRRTFETNFFNVVALTQKLLPLIKKAPAGRIVNLSSALASLTLHSDPKSPIYHHKLFPYDATKTVINAFTVHLAYDLRDTKIKVNSADPGWVKTDMGGEGAVLEIEDGAKTSVRLATLPEDGPTGGYFHMKETNPW